MLAAAGPVIMLPLLGPDERDGSDCVRRFLSVTDFAGKPDADVAEGLDGGQTRAVPQVGERRCTAL